MDKRQLMSATCEEDRRPSSGARVSPRPSRLVPPLPSRRTTVAAPPGGAGRQKNSEEKKRTNKKRRKKTPGSERAGTRHSPPRVKVGCDEAGQFARRSVDAHRHGQLLIIRGTVHRPVSCVSVITLVAAISAQMGNAIRWRQGILYNHPYVFFFSSRGRSSEEVSKLRFVHFLQTECSLGSNSKMQMT